MPEHMARALDRADVERFNREQHYLNYPIERYQDEQRAIEWHREARRPVARQQTLTLEDLEKAEIRRLLVEKAKAAGPIAAEKEDEAARYDEQMKMEAAQRAEEKRARAAELEAMPVGARLRAKTLAPIKKVLSVFQPKRRATFDTAGASKGKELKELKRRATFEAEKAKKVQLTAAEVQAAKEAAKEAYVDDFLGRRCSRSLRRDFSGSKDNSADN